MKINQAGLDLIKSFEGCRLEAYQDIVGIWTIGYGHVSADVHPGLTITQAQADDLLAKDLKRFEDGVSALCPQVNENQFSALVCLSYNIGLSNLKSSTLLKKLNVGDVSGAADQFLVWDKAGGKPVAGLLRRRQAERALFLV